MKQMADQPAEAPENFGSLEQDLGELEKIVNQMEAGELSLDDSLKLFERGVALSNACRQRLDAAEAKIEILLNKNGTMKPQPFSTEDDE
jgi:exodeoxyribonuclease VII small subunit